MRFELGRWGSVIVALIIAGLLVGLSLWYASGGYRASSVSKIVALTPEEARLIENAALTMATSTGSSTVPVSTVTAADFANYRAPTAIAPSDALARELFATYFSLQKDGKLNTTEESRALQDVVARHATTTMINTYTAGDIVKAKTNDAAAINTYHIQVINALSASNAVTEYEIGTFLNYFKTGDQKYSVTLTKDATVYRSIVASLLKISVPPLLVATHLTLVNSLSALADSVATLSSAKDPLVAMGAVNGFTTAEKAFTQAFTDFTTLTTVK